MGIRSQYSLVSAGVRVPLQCLRRPALGQQPDGVPAFPLPGRGRQNHTSVHILGIHLPLFEKPVRLPHSHHQPPQLPRPADSVACQFTPCFCAFHLGFGLALGGDRKQHGISVVLVLGSSPLLRGPSGGTFSKCCGPGPSPCVGHLGDQEDGCLYDGGPREEPGPEAQPPGRPGVKPGSCTKRQPPVVRPWPPASVRLRPASRRPLPTRRISASRSPAPAGGAPGPPPAGHVPAPPCPAGWARPLRRR